MNSEQVRFKQQDVVAYLEDKIQSGNASENEELIYEQYSWTGRLEKGTYYYKQIIHNMIKEYNGI